MKNAIIEISDAERESNLQGLISEDHDLTGLEAKVDEYLNEAENHLSELASKLKARLDLADEGQWERLQNIKSQFDTDIEQTFVALAHSLSEMDKQKLLQGDNAAAVSENPMLPIMMAYKKSLFKAKGEMEESITNTLHPQENSEKDSIETHIRDYLLTSAKAKALLGMAGLKDSGYLSKILLKLTFSLASIGITVPFINWAPEDVVNEFWRYLDIQKKTGLQVPFVEFYKNPKAYN